jgi:hypothetical protein
VPAVCVCVCVSHSEAIFSGMPIINNVSASKEIMNCESAVPLPVQSSSCLL